MMKKAFLSLLCVAALMFSPAVYGQEKGASVLLPVVQGGKWGYINRAGEVVIAPQFNLANNFSEGLAAVLTRDGWGYIDATGRMVIAPNRGFFHPGAFSEGLAPVGVNSTKMGYIDRTGRVVIEPQFDKAYEFSDGLARVQDGGKYGYINKSGQLVVDLMFDDARDFSNGVAFVSLGERQGYIDKTGKYVWKPSK